MKVGTLVILVRTDGYTPPLGSVGEVVSSLDQDGDYEVWFKNHPCPVGEEITWFCQQSWLLPISGTDSRVVKEKEIVLI
jgi:hypothetical protein